MLQRGHNVAHLYSHVLVYINDVCLSLEVVLSDQATRPVDRLSLAVDIGSVQGQVRGLVES